MFNRSGMLSLAMAGAWLVGTTGAWAQEYEPEPEAAPEPVYDEAPIQEEAAPPPPAPPPAQWAPPPEQEEPAPMPNSLYLEGLGAGLYYSLNYERRVIEDLAVRIGFGYVSMSASAGTSSASSSVLTIPITASYLGIRGVSSGLELGGGATLIYASSTASSGGVTAFGSGMGAVGTFMVGYRYHPAGRAGFNFRVGLMALLGRGLSLSAADPGAFGMLPWGYISMGASF
jgi:hypothetical protein